MVNQLCSLMGTEWLIRYSFQFSFGSPGIMTSLFFSGYSHFYLLICLFVCLFRVHFVDSTFSQVLFQWLNYFFFVLFWM